MGLKKEGKKTVSAERRERLYTSSGIPVDLVYAEGPPHELGAAGDYPFTRGVYETMYRGRLWTMRQYSGYATAQETNSRFQYLLRQGQTGLSVAFDLPTQIGYDSDHPLADGEVGRTGVAIDLYLPYSSYGDGFSLQTLLRVEIVEPFQNCT